MQPIINCFLVLTANLRSHVKNKHSKKPPKPRKGVVGAHQAVSCHRTYQCSECPEAFVREDSLRSHCRLHRKGILPPAALSSASEEAAQVTNEPLATAAVSVPRLAKGLPVNIWILCRTTAQ